MYAPIKGTGRTIGIGDGYQFLVTEAFQMAADTVSHQMIMRDCDPTDTSYFKAVITHAEIMRQELRKQIPLDEADDSTRFNRKHLIDIAGWAGNWDVERGIARGARGGWAVAPIKSTMDIALDPEVDAANMKAREATRRANFEARVGRPPVGTK